MYTEASCDNQRQVTRRRGKQIIYISLKIDPNVNELLLEIWSLRQISPTAAQMGRTQLEIEIELEIELSCGQT